MQTEASKLMLGNNYANRFTSGFCVIGQIIKYSFESSNADSTGALARTHTSERQAASIDVSGENIIARRRGIKVSPLSIILALISRIGFVERKQSV